MKTAKIPSEYRFKGRPLTAAEIQETRKGDNPFSRSWELQADVRVVGVSFRVYTPSPRPQYDQHARILVLAHDGDSADYGEDLAMEEWSEGMYTHALACITNYVRCQFDC